MEFDILLSDGLGDYSEEVSKFNCYMMQVSEIVKWSKVAKDHIRNMRLRLYAKALECIRFQQMMKDPSLLSKKGLKRYLANHRHRLSYIKRMRKALNLVRKLCESQVRWVKRLQKEIDIETANNALSSEKKECNKLLNLMVNEQMDCCEILQERIEQMLMPTMDENIEF